MNAFDDDDDVRADELLAGRTGPRDEPLAAVLGQLRALADEPAPLPTPALAAVLRDGLPAAVLDSPIATARARSRVLRGARWAASLGLAGKVLLSAGIAAAAVAGTATIPAVPDAVQVPVRTALTDLHLIPGPADRPVPTPSTTTPEPVGGVDATPAVGTPSAGPAHPSARDDAPEGFGPAHRPFGPVVSAPPRSGGQDGQGEPDVRRPPAGPPTDNPTPQDQHAADHPRPDGASTAPAATAPAATAPAATAPAATAAARGAVGGNRAED